jgi:polysaccharide deacetylase family protein (PEP-CTERM system associated)
LILTIKHHLTIDVEEFFHASALEKRIPREHWDDIPRRSPELVRKLLDDLAESGVRATFFFLGWLARREPEIVRAVSQAGHEIASHGWDHRRVTGLSPGDFEDDIRRTRDLLEDLSGQSVQGYRAPSFSILPGFEWALDVLLAGGFRYDSSLNPVRVHPGYGYPGSPRDPHRLLRPGGSLLEFPPSTLRLGTLNLPAAGGAYLRFFPVALMHKALSSAETRGEPGTLYVHPWEFDDNIPAFSASWWVQLRMRGRTGNTKRKLNSLITRFRFQTMGETAERILGKNSQEGP